MSNYGRPIPLQFLPFDDIEPRLTPELLRAFDLPGYGSDSATDLVGPGRWSWITTPDGDHAGVVWTNDRDITSVFHVRRPDFDPVAFDVIALSLRSMRQIDVAASRAFDRIRTAHAASQVVSGDLSDIRGSTR